MRPIVSALLPVILAAALAGFLDLNVPALPGWLRYSGAFAGATGHQPGHPSSLAADGVTEEEA